ncbi:hypothetical protein COU95_01515 [Candidatus Shapirobacteria bacterium CG10_big_fil_rev_8_21_14_0_10_40_9]|uniref:DNA-directed DNA polymerase n=1 Tax=Candidatus Shapirobacteria bacterium CG10_big_fil_rev_8_21_14_0_10_40_9 TaxID=1974888 RepID=A0A2M8L3Y9_9BACT|nr:MAG: hypothetical protein COU95_01515 [Candidatus Shapirobacteria bacterium CG10_big_fil_rev_8_21_14_0_10_40_9]
MIKIIHGDNIVQSRKRLTEILEKARKEGTEIVYLDGTKVTITEVRSALESGSLFGKNRLVVIENLKEKPEILTYLKKGKFDNDLILWEQKEIKREIIPGVELEIFKLPPLIFSFLESIRPGSSKESLRLLSELKKGEEPEMIFYMLVRQFRFLILARDLGDSGLSDLSLWQQKKFLKQAENFSLEQLLEIYRKLLEIDFKQKTSSDPYSLSSRLDLLTAEI